MHTPNLTGARNHEGPLAGGLTPPPTSPETKSFSPRTTGGGGPKMGEGYLPPFTKVAGGGERPRPADGLGMNRESKQKTKIKQKAKTQNPSIKNE